MKYIKKGLIKKIKFFMAVIVATIALLIVLFILVLVYPNFFIKSWHFWYGDLMSDKQVCQHWGEGPLDIKKFKQAKDNLPIRAKMVCSLIKNKKQFIGKDALKIREIFGDFEGHYFIDVSPAYFIEDGSKKNKDVWQIVFLVDRHENISDIFVHKNCCHY